MRWGRRREAPEASEADATPGGGVFAPVTQVPDRAAPELDGTDALARPSVTADAAPGLWPPGLSTGEIEVPGPADAASEHPVETSPEPRAVEQIAPAVADAVAPSLPHDAGEDDAVDPVDLAVPLSGTVPTATPRRGGRNLWLASVVGTLLALGALVAAWWDPLAFAVTIYAFCIAAVIEWRNALARLGMHVSLPPVLLATVGMGVATWFGRGEGLVVALLVASAGVLAWRIVDDRIENTLADSLVAILTLTWIPFLASFMLLMELSRDGWKLVLIVFAAVALSDTLALFTGILFGRRPLAPRVSPKKTWEGAIGGAVFGIAGAAGFAYALLDGRWWVGAAVGAVCVVAAVLGDLAESALKRDIHVKDMSSAIPGHGGFLDRLDSMLPAGAAAYVVFALLLDTL